MVLKMNKSPFYVVNEFLSPLLCEVIVDECEFFTPDVDKDGFAVKTIKTNDKAEQLIYERLSSIIPILQEHYNFIYRGTERIQFEWYPSGSNSIPISENSIFSKGKWSRTKVRDFTGILFLSDYQDHLPFESDYEVYGGKLEFAQHKFGFNPTRGTLIFFPSDPHFINNTATILAGDLYQARIQIAANQSWIYNLNNYPGNYTNWF